MALAIIKEFDDKINKLTAEYRMKDSRCKFLIETERDKDGYMKSVKSLLLACEQNSELNAGVEGVLASLISVDKKCNRNVLRPGYAKYSYENRNRCKKINRAFA